MNQMILKQMKGTLPLLFLFVLLCSCQSLKMASAKRSLKQELNKSTLLNDHFYGFALFDPTTNEYLYQYQVDKHFTPASNTKLFTFYAGLKLLGDSIPGLHYTISGDSLIFWGTGDPTFLHERFPQQPVFEFLQSSPFDLYLAVGNYADEKYGPGWSWDDYNDSYQVERSAFPIYGNLAKFQLNGDSVPTVIPGTLQQQVVPYGNGYPSAPVVRSRISNLFYINRPHYGDTPEVPFVTYPELVGRLLMDTLKRKIRLVDYRPRSHQTLYSQPVGPVYAWMLQPSDNFLAEQLLISAAAYQEEPLSGNAMIRKMRGQYLNDLTDKPIWMDGSGLSRYNLFTPRTMVELLVKIRTEMPDETLFRLLPAGGVSGTIKDWYHGGSEPYVFAKTGTLRNNHCLSGYLKTNTGKVLIFSFMNNNYTNGSASVKKGMQEILELIRDRY